jgi:peroxiredoxin
MLERRPPKEMAMAVGSTMLPLGTPAPDFTLSDPSGAIHNLDDAAGPKGLLVVFACNHCPYVKHLARELGLLCQRWASRGLGIVAINSNDIEAFPADAPPLMADFARRYG